MSEAIQHQAPEVPDTVDSKQSATSGIIRGIIGSLTKIFYPKPGNFVVIDPLDKRDQDLAFPAQFAQDVTEIYSKS